MKIVIQDSVVTVKRLAGMVGVKPRELLYDNPGLELEGATKPWSTVSRKAIVGVLKAYGHEALFPEEVAKAREAEREAAVQRKLEEKAKEEQAIQSKLREKARSLKISYAADWTIGRLSQAIDETETILRMEGVLETKQLCARAERLGIEVRPEWTKEILRQIVRQATQERGLLRKAEKMGMSVHPDWNTDKLRSEVKKHETRLKHEAAVHTAASRIWADQRFARAKELHRAYEEAREAGYQMPELTEGQKYTGVYPFLVMWAIRMHQTTVELGHGFYGVVGDPGLCPMRQNHVQWTVIALEAMREIYVAPQGAVVEREVLHRVFSREENRVVHVELDPSVEAVVAAQDMEGRIHMKLEEIFAEAGPVAPVVEQAHDRYDDIDQRSKRSAKRKGFKKAIQREDHAVRAWSATEKKKESPRAVIPARIKVSKLPEAISLLGGGLSRRVW